MPTGTLTSKGQTTIPREVREFLKLKPGDTLEFRVNPEDRTVTLKAANIPILALQGILKRRGMKTYNPNERSLAYSKRAAKK
jgi:AbrB family looped-hinge helix DNA binding protein